MDEHILSFSKRLIEIPSDPDNSEALSEALEFVTSKLDGFTIERFEKAGVASILAYVGDTRPEKFTLILNGHLDVIPGKPEQYIPRVEGDRLYGVGAMDMKANLACAIHVFKELAPKVAYPLGLQVVTDEEVGGFNGTKYQVDSGVSADFVLATEPTNFDIVHEAKGIIWLDVTFTGVTAHGAYPWRGDNAIWKMHEFLTALKKVYPIPSNEGWVTTVNVACITVDNTAPNKVPDSARLTLDIRCIPEDQHDVLERIQTLVPKGSTMDVRAQESPLNTDTKSEHVRILQRITESILGREVVLRKANGSSDARHFAAIGCPGIEFGPIGEGIGSDCEWVNISSISQFREILTAFILDLDSK